MAAKYNLQVQCFVKRNAALPFAPGTTPRLLYVSRVRPQTNVHPRILHAHKDHIELLLICAGSSDFLIHNHKVPVKTGDLVLYNSGIVHDDLTGPDSNLSYYCLAIGELKIPGLRDNALADDAVGRVFSTGEDFEALKSLCEMMFHSLSSGEENAEIICNCLMQACLVKALAIIGKSQGIKSQQLLDEDILGNRIQAYIDAHYREQLTLQDIGDSLNISPYYLSHVFKRMSGYSPIQYLLRRRIGEAQTLLISTDMPIAEIAGAVGFDTQNYFNSQFTKHVGIPPRKYRDNYVVKEK